MLARSQTSPRAGVECSHTCLIKVNSDPCFEKKYATPSPQYIARCGARKTLLALRDQAQGLREVRADRHRPPTVAAYVLFNKGKNMRFATNGLVALGFAVLLSGCVTPLPKQQTFDRVANAKVKTIHVMPMSKIDMQVVMMNNPAGSFGLIGALIASGQASSMQHTVLGLYASEPIHPRQYFQAQLTKDLTARGYVVVWPVLDEAAGAKHSRSGLRDTYTSVNDADAILDVDLDFFGFAAGGAGKGSPYRPTATAVARLVGADGKQTYFTDYFAYNNVFNSKVAVTMEPDPRYVYPGFSDLEHAGAASEPGLKLALSEVARKLASEL